MYHEESIQPIEILVAMFAKKKANPMKPLMATKMPFRIFFSKLSPAYRYHTNEKPKEFFIIKKFYQSMIAMNAYEMHTKCICNKIISSAKRKWKFHSFNGTAQTSDSSADALAQNPFREFNSVITVDNTIFHMNFHDDFESSHKRFDG